MRPRRHGVPIATLALVLALATAAAAQTGAVWGAYGGDAANTRYSTLTQINAGNVERLKVAWALQLGTLRSQESTPILVGDTLYVTSSHGPKNVFAVDAKTLADEEHPILVVVFSPHSLDAADYERPPKAAPVEEIQTAIRYGVRKINIDTDIRLAMTGAIRRFLFENPSKFDPREYNKPAREAAKQVCKARFEAFGSAGQAAKIKPVPLEKIAARYKAGELSQIVR